MSSVVGPWFFYQILVFRSWLHVQVWRQPISASGFALSRIGLASPIFSSTPRWWHNLATTVPGSSGYIDGGTHSGCCGYSPLTSTFHMHEVLWITRLYLMVLLMEWLDHILLRRWKTSTALPIVSLLCQLQIFNIRLVGDVAATGNFQHSGVSLSQLRLAW